MSEPSVSLAFNAGSDARLAGRPSTANPYVEDGLRDAWLKGWQHCEHFWGADAKRTARELPEIVRRWQ